MRTRIKICGITRPEDAALAARLGVDAVGLVFHPPSPRHLTPARAAAIVTALPAFVTPVAVFMDADPETVRAVLDEVPVAMLQFHGAESPQMCAAWGLPYIKAVPMADTEDVAVYGERYRHAAGLLCDSHGSGRAAGRGRTFEWSRLGAASARALILAGGLDADNVAAAVSAVRPYAVDVSSGVESEPGVKDPDRMRAFVRGVERADAEPSEAHAGA
ncbi:MAG: phosphoribosylanthranilate isomerase [Gammaproteobacteria bacterium]|nr:phosphoribosylanthranilate isomerase [Gammaproteobacteria bacterium]